MKKEKKERLLTKEEFEQKTGECDICPIDMNDRGVKIEYKFPPTSPGKESEYYYTYLSGRYGDFDFGAMITELTRTFKEKERKEKKKKEKNMNKDNKVTKQSTEKITKIDEDLISLTKRVEKIENIVSELVNKNKDKTIPDNQLSVMEFWDNEEEDDWNDWGHDLDKDREYLERKKEKEEEEKK